MSILHKYTMRRMAPDSPQGMRRIPTYYRYNVYTKVYICIHIGLFYVLPIWMSRWDINSPLDIDIGPALKLVYAVVSKLVYDVVRFFHI